MPLDELARVEQRVLPVVREQPDHRDRQERQEVLVVLDHLDSLVAVDCRVLRVALEEVESEESLELLVPVGYPVCQEVPVELVCQAEQVLQVNLELLE